MNLTTHTIDPEGEVIIVLRNANSPFAQVAGDQSTLQNLKVSPWICGNAQSIQGLIKAPRFHVNQTGPSLEEKSGERKSRKMRKKERRKKATAEKPTTEQPPAEEAVAEEPTAPEPAAEEYPAEDPAAEGPVIEETFVEGHFAESSAHNCFRIQVSAKHLTFASPVFKSRLTGGWNKSVAFLQKRSVETVADSWDIEALMILLRAIHGHYYNIPKMLTLEMLAKVAVIAHYYECRETLCFLTDVWIEKLEDKIPEAASKDLVLWLWIAWFFRLPSQFKLSTSIAMSQSEGSIDSLGLPIPENVIVSINEGREKAIQNLILLLNETRNAFLLGTRGCRLECRSIMYGALTMQMQSNSLLLPENEGPFPNLDYRSLVQGVKAFESPEWYDSSSRYSSYESSHVQRCAEASLASIFGSLEESLEGLELSRFTSH